MNEVRKSALAFAAPLLVLVAGCSRLGVSMNDQVEGTVTLDAKPLPRVTIQFIPDIEGATQQAPLSTAVSDDQGRFTLTCANGRPGAIIGKHNVVVLAGRGGSNNPDDPQAAQDPRPNIPGVYLTAAKTPLQIEVSADQHSYELKLKSSYGMPR